MKSQNIILVSFLILILNGCADLSEYKVDPVLETPIYEEPGLNWSPLERLNDGFMQILSGLVEPANQMGKEITERKNPISAFIPGLAKGFGMLIAREVVGIFEIVTFFLPLERHLEPIDTSWIPESA